MACMEMGLSSDFEVSCWHLLRLYFKLKHEMIDQRRYIMIVADIVKAAMATIVEMTNGVKILNTTPHPLTFQDGDKVVSVPVSGILINGRPVEKEVPLSEHMVEGGLKGKITLVQTEFVTDEKSMELIRVMEELCGDDVLFIGSLAAAQAYPGTILAMIPQPGFERVPPDQKRMRVDRFTTF